jgi:hypothetical protein
MEHLYRATPLGAIALMIRANRMQRKWNATIARDVFSSEDFANPYSFFIALPIDYMPTGRRSVLNSLRYRDVSGGIENDRNSRGNSMPLTVPLKSDAARRSIFQCISGLFGGSLQFSPNVNAP